MYGGDQLGVTGARLDLRSGTSFLRAGIESCSSDQGDDVPAPHPPPPVVSAPCEHLLQSGYLVLLCDGPWPGLGRPPVSWRAGWGSKKLTGTLGQLCSSLATPRAPGQQLARELRQRSCIGAG